MAVVGSARIIVRAITTGVERDIRNVFKNSGRIGGQAGKEMGSAFSRGFSANSGNTNFFYRVANGLRALRPQANGAYKAFASLQRKFYTMSTGLSGLIGGIGSLVGALGALIGAVGAATPSLVAFISAMMSFRLMGVVANMALGGVSEAVNALNASGGGLAKTTKQIREEMKQLAFDAEEAALGERRAALSLEEAREQLAMVQDLPPNSRVRREAELAYAEADLNMRRAIDQNKKAQDALDKGPDTGGGGAGALASAMARLNKYQKEFARYLASLKPKLDELRLAISREFLPRLQDALEVLVKTAFPTVKQGLSDIAAGAGEAAKNFVEIATKKDSLAAVGAVLEAQGGFLAQFGTAAGYAFSGFMKLLEAANPLLEAFGGFLIRISQEFDNWLDTKKASGELQGFFDTALTVTQQLGDIFRNVLGAFGGLIEASVGEGSGGKLLLDWFQEVTAKWNELANTVEGQSNLRDALYQASANAKAFLQLMGGLIGVLSSGLNTPNLEAFFRAIEDALPSVQLMLEEVGDALPIFGSLIGNILRFFGAFAQSGAVTIFFGILNDVMKVLADIMQNETVQQVIILAAQVHAVALAFGLMGDVAGKAINYVVDGLATFNETMGMIVQHPILAVIGALAALFVYLYNTNEPFRKSMDELFNKVMAAAIPIIQRIGEVFSFVIDLFGKLGGASGAMDGLVGILTTFATIVADLFIGLMPIMEELVYIFAGVGAMIMNVVAQALPPLMSLFQSLVPVIVMVAGVVMELVESFLANLFPVMMRLAPVVGNIINTLVRVVQDLTPVLFIVMEVLVQLGAVLFDVLGIILPPLIEIVGALVPVVTDVFAIIASLAGLVMSFLAPALALIGNIISVLLGPAFDFIGGVLKVFINVIGGVIAFIKAIVVPVFNFFGAIIAALATPIRNVTNFFKVAWTGIGAFFRGLVNTIIGYFQNFINFIIRGLNSFFRPLRDAINGVLQALGVKFQFSVIPTVTLPRLAKGGVVLPSAGGSLVNIAEAGKPEKVVPLDSNGLSQGDKAVLAAIKGEGAGGGGMSITMNITAPEGMDVKELAAEVSRTLAFRMRKGAIA